MDFYIDMTEYSVQDREYILDRLSEEPAMPSVMARERFLESVYWVFREGPMKYMVFYSDRVEPPREAVPIDVALDRETG